MSADRRVAWLSALSAATVFTVSLAQAESGTFEYDYCFASQLTTLKHSETHVVNLSHAHGTIRATSPGQLFDNMTAQCLSLSGEIERDAFGQAYCELIDHDGDRALEHLQRAGGEGTLRSVAGTGKFQNIKIEGTYARGRFPQKPGMLQSCLRAKGRWERP